MIPHRFKVPMQRIDFEDALAQVVARDPRYTADAYRFLQVALTDAVSVQRKETRGEDRHVSGAELLEAFRKRSLKEYGPMVMTVFGEWGISCGEDVGEMVFNLIDIGAFGKSERDRREDFVGVYDFNDAFVVPFLPASKRETSGGGDRGRGALR